MKAALPVPLGSIIGGYRLEAVIGAGGMGCVFRGIHVKLGRKAAVKVLAEALASDPAYVSRFFHEARVVNQVGHPNIIDIVDFIEEENPRRVAYVMELVNGPSLTGVLKSRRLLPIQAVHVTLQLVDALRAVHSINVIHRDLKPDNLLVTGSLDTDLSAKPAIKVLDFGIAKISDAQTGHKTGTGMMLGTPAYMSPEQVAGESVSAATDVYAVGEILYEMLAGKRMFEGQNMVILRAKINEKAPEVTLPADVPAAERFSALIRACVATDQTQRPTIDAIERELIAISYEQPGVAAANIAATPSGQPQVGLAASTPSGLRPAQAAPTPSPAFAMPKSSPTNPPLGASLAPAPSGSGAQPIPYGPLPSGPGLPVASNTPVPGAALATPLGALATIAPSVADDAPARPSSKKTAVMFAGVFLAVGGAATTFALMSRDDEVDVAPIVEPAKPATRMVEISSRPEGAVVRDAKTKAVLGAAPLKVEVATSGEKRSIELELAGHVSRTLELDPARGHVLAVMTANEPIEKPAQPAAPPPAPIADKKAAPPAKKAVQPAQPAEQPGESAPLKKGAMPTW